MVYLNIPARVGGRIFVLTRSDIGGIVPSSRIIATKYMYLFHMYRTRETQDFGDRQMYRYSCPDVRKTSYKSSAIDLR